MVWYSSKAACPWNSWTRYRRSLHRWTNVNADEHVKFLLANNLAYLLCLKKLQPIRRHRYFFEAFCRRVLYLVGAYRHRLRPEYRFSGTESEVQRSTIFPFFALERSVLNCKKILFSLFIKFQLLDFCTFEQPSPLKDRTDRRQTKIHHCYFLPRASSRLKLASVGPQEIFILPLYKISTHRPLHFRTTFTTQGEDWQKANKNTPKYGTTLIHSIALWDSHCRTIASCPRRA
jgi:hypothetical protein